MSEREPIPLQQRAYSQSDLLEQHKQKEATNNGKSKRRASISPMMPAPEVNQLKIQPKNIYLDTTNAMDQIPPPSILSRNEKDIRIVMQSNWMHDDNRPPGPLAPFRYRLPPPLVPLAGTSKNTSPTPPPMDLNKLAKYKRLSNRTSPKTTSSPALVIVPKPKQEIRSVSTGPRRKSKSPVPTKFEMQKEPSTPSNPLQELLDGTIDEDQFVTILEKQSAEQRRSSIRDLASQFKRLMTLVSFTSNIAGELDLEKAIEQITEHVKEILQADRATLFLIDERKKELWAKVKRDNIGQLRIPIDKGIASHVARTGNTVNIANAYNSPDFLPEIDRITGYHTRSVLCMPVKDANGKTVAVIQALNKKGGIAFTDEDEHILKTLCIQTAITLRNSQMYTSSLMQQHKIQVLLEVAKELSSELEPTSLITKIMAKARALLEADRCTLFLLDKEKEQLWSKVAEGTQEIRFPMRLGIAGHVATTGETLNIPEAYNDPRFNKEIDLKTGYRTKSILCMPLRNNQGEIIGATQVLNKKDDNNDGVFDEDDEELLSAFSAQAGVAIENSQLFQKTLEMRTFLESVLKSINNLVLTLDEEGKLMTCNRMSDLTALIGISELVMKTTNYHTWLSKKNCPFAKDIEAVYLSPQEIVNMDFDFTRPDTLANGKPKVVSRKDTGVPLVDFQGKQRGVVIVIEDITPQKRMMSTLSRYMSPALAEQVIKEGGDRLGGVHVTVTTLFIDIRNFTGMSESMDAADVVEMLNEYFEHMVNAIFEENGVLDKYIGDAVMAVFGVPFSMEDDAARACRAAIKMLKNLKKFNKRREEQGKQAINVGIGINTGRVLSGNIGSEKRLEYTVIGDGVNLASRIEGVTKHYGVKTIISEYTNKEIEKDHFITREIDSITVVGKSKPIRIFELLGASQEEVDPLVWSIMPTYAQALQLYRSMNFIKAAQKFQYCVDIADDAPSKVLLGRCHKFMEDPPPSDWNGTWTLHEK